MNDATGPLTVTVSRVELDEERCVIRIAFAGTAGVGSEGNVHGLQMRTVITDVLNNERPFGLIVDLRELDYRMGNWIATWVQPGIPLHRTAILAVGDTLIRIYNLWAAYKLTSVFPVFDNLEAAYSFTSGGEATPYVPAPDTAAAAPSQTLAQPPHAGQVNDSAAPGAEPVKEVDPRAGGSGSGTARHEPPRSGEWWVVPKKLLWIRVDDSISFDGYGYLVIGPTHRSFYNLDGIIHAREPIGWRAIATLGEVETADDFERLTGARPQVFVEACRVCGEPSLLVVDVDKGVCVDCQSAIGAEGEAVN